MLEFIKLVAFFCDLKFVIRNFSKFLMQTEHSTPRCHCINHSAIVGNEEKRLDAIQRMSLSEKNLTSSVFIWVKGKLLTLFNGL